MPYAAFVKLRLGLCRLKDATWVDTTQKQYPCPVDFINVNDAVARPKSKEHVPILNIEQITWISAVTRTVARSRAAQGKAHNFLVHGLG
jgi:hypothetical protein